MEGDAIFKYRYSRRDFIRKSALTGGLLAGGSALSGLLAACSKGTTPGPGTKTGVKFLTWELYADPSFVKPFEAKHGPIKTTYFGSFDEMFGKLRSGGGSAYDTVMTASDVVQPLVETKELAPIDINRIPNFKNLYPNFQNSPRHVFDGKHYAIPIDWGSQVIHIDSQQVPNVPDVLDFNILFDPAYKGKVATMDDQVVVWNTALLLGHSTWWDLTDTQLADVQKFLVDKLTPQVRKFAGTFADMANLFANHEVVVGLGWTGVIHAELVKAGATWVVDHDFTPTAPWYLDTMSLAAGAKDIDASYAWMDFSLGAQASAKRFELMGLPTVVPGAKQYLTPDEQHLSKLDDPSFFANLPADLEWHPIPRRDAYQQVWNSVKAGTA